MTDVVNVGSTDNDGNGDTLRAAFSQINTRFNELLSTIDGGDAWATGVTYTATPIRQWVIESGQAYVAAVNHVSGASFAADLAAGKWFAVDSAQILADLAAPTGASLIGYTPTGLLTATTVEGALNEVRDASKVSYTPAGAGAVATDAQTKLRESVSGKDFGAVGDGVADDIIELSNLISNLPQRGQIKLTAATAYKITDTLEVFDKAGAVIDFGNQQINAASFAAPAPALHFKGVSQAVIDNIFVLGNTTNVNTGVLFDADVSNITIHAKVGKVYVASCDVGIVVGALTHQFSDSQMEDLYASDCNTGIIFTGENTLAMDYGRVSAYNNTSAGVRFEQGGGTIRSLQVAASGSNLFFGASSGLDHNKLERWDILGGYSEQGVNGEIFINSTACADTNPFLEQITISGFRSTPFTSTNVEDFIRWNLNGDLILKDFSMNHGQQLPYISVDPNPAFRAPRVDFSGVIDCAPTSAVQVPMTYKLTDPRQVVEINARVNNGMTFWQNDGIAAEGTIKRGIYMHKLKKFEQSLLSIGGLTGAWNLRDITSGTCRNLVLGAPSLAASATLERRDFWLDDGLIGFFRNSTTSKTISTSSSVYSAASEYTFGAILRATNSSTSEEDQTNIGGTSGMRLSLSSGGLLCLVGGANAYNGAANFYDPHLVIGRYVSSTSINVDAINLRTGAVYSAETVAGIPAFGALAWTNGINFRNDACVRGFPFVYNRALTDNEVLGLLQSSLNLTDSWRDA